MDTISKILDLMARRGISQKELCKYLGIGEPKFTDWKKGRIKSYTKYLPSIASFFGITVDELISETNETQNQNLLELTNNEKELLSVIRKLSSERDQVKLIGVADNYAKTLASYVPDIQNNFEEGSDAQQRTGKVG